MAYPRRAQVRRKTQETDVGVEINLDGCGTSTIATPFPFLNHMLGAFAKHGFFDLTVTARGDTDIDDHHTIEDIGIVMGQAIAKACGEKTGIRRFGHAVIPLDEALAQMTVDLSGRPYLVYQVPLGRRKIKLFDVEMVEHFFHSLADNGKMTLHITLLYGKYPHHILEAIFKGFGRALDQATQLDGRQQGVPSTKGAL